MLFSGRTTPKLLFLVWISIQSNTCSLGPHESAPAPKRHLARFSDFCTAHPCDQHTDRCTDGDTEKAGVEN